MAVRTSRAGLPGRPRLLAPVLVVVALLLLLGGIGVSLYTDLLWFRDVDYVEVFSTVLQTRLLLFVLFGVLMAVIVGANITVAYRVRPPFRPLSLEQQNLERYRLSVEPYLVPLLLLASGVFGLFAGLSASSRWETWLLWRNRTDFGVNDAQFGRDVSYFAMTYPFQRFVLGFLLTAIVLSLIAAAATHYLFGGLRLQTVGEKVSPAARAHLSVLIGLIVLLKAVAYYLDRFGLAFSERGHVQGPSYTDVNAVLPAKNILIGVAVICSLLFFANIVVRNILLPAGALGLLVISAVVLGGLFPAYTQQFRVGPNEVALESKFIDRNIDATRQAYDIDDAQVEEYDAQSVASAELRSETGTNARLLDPNVLAPTFEQQQRQRSYFGTNPKQLDVDRYTVDGDTQDYVVAAREVDLSNLAQGQRNWINEHLTYTHGNGFIAAPANRVDEEGQPVYEVRDVPVRGINGESPIPIKQPRIYFGELSPEYSVVNTKQGEIDGPEVAGKQSTINYTGDGGVRLSGPLRKVAYALKYREPNLLLSTDIQDRSRIMYVREPRERVKKVAPFLELDGNPYPAVVDGRILWIVDGYTTSAGFPYAQRSDFGEVTQDSRTGRLQPREQVNYIRNSVKATVDAFTGDVQLYQFGERDAVLQTWSKAFRGIIQPESAISDELRQHLRYPEDLFRVQRDLLAEYHEEDPRAFYNREDFWEVPGDPAQAVNQSANTTDNAAPQQLNVNQVTSEGPKQPPFYSLLKFPNEEATRFSLSTSFVALNRPNLAAFASVSSDAEDYGKLRVLTMTRNDVQGPGQVANTFLTNPQVAESLLALRRSGQTELTFGNLLTLPVGNGLLYVQPVFVRAQAAQGSETFPTLQQVIVSFGTQTASGTTLDAALRSLFSATGTPPAATPNGSGGGPTTSPSPGTTTSPPAPTGAPGTLAEAAAAADQALRDGQAALARQDFAAYGAAQERLQAAVQRVVELSRADGTAAPGTPGTAAQPTGAPSATPTG